VHGSRNIIGKADTGWVSIRRADVHRLGASQHHVYLWIRSWILRLARRRFDYEVVLTRNSPPMYWRDAHIVYSWRISDRRGAAGWARSLVSQPSVE
jgi:hypothetical protein